MKRSKKTKRKLTEYERDLLRGEIVATIEAYFAIAVIAAMLTLVPMCIIMGIVKLILMFT